MFINYVTRKHKYRIFQRTKDIGDHRHRKVLVVAMVKQFIAYKSAESPFLLAETILLMYESIYIDIDSAV